MKSFLKFKEMIDSSTTVINAAKVKEEQTKLGLARAGSSGAITEDGRHYYTQCGRIAQSRLLGFERAPTASMLTMFEGGLALETFLEKGLVAIGADFEKEQPTEGKVGAVPVSGRPDFDIVIDGEVVGVEVKSMASPFSAIKQVKNGYPLIKHMVQAATYIILKKRNKWIVAVGNIFYANERGFRVNPGVRYYQVDLHKETGVFTVTNEKAVIATLPFKVEDIERYYANLKQANKDKALMPRPTEFELNMSTYSRCKYCSLDGNCNSYENGQLTFEEWMKLVPTSEEEK